MNRPGLSREASKERIGDDDKIQQDAEVEQEDTRKAKIPRVSLFGDVHESVDSTTLDLYRSAEESLDLARNQEDLSQRKRNQLTLRAKSFLRQAADNGHAHAAYRLSTLVDDWDEEIRLLHRAGNLGHASALCQLGFIYQRSCSTETEPHFSQASLDCYHRAMGLGHADAVLNLFKLYEKGNESMGIPMDMGYCWKLLKILASLVENQRTEEERKKSTENWKKFLGAAGKLEEALQTGAIALLNSDWLLCHARSPGNLARPRQRLPSEAFMTFEQIVYSSRYTEEMPICCIQLHVA